MRSRGMTYDTGFVRRGEISPERLDPEVVRRELAIVRDDLHCNAVQITGGDADRVGVAARIAAELGLEVWISRPTRFRSARRTLRRIAGQHRLPEPGTADAARGQVLMVMSTRRLFDHGRTALVST